jgi:hypothetical protein
MKLGKAISLQARTGPYSSRISRYEGGKFVKSYAPAAFTPKKIFLVLISVSPQGHSAPERIKSMKIAMTLSGIEPAIL